MTARGMAPGKINKWGTYICGDCLKKDHHGGWFYGLCGCTCSGRFDTKGNAIEKGKK